MHRPIPTSRSPGWSRTPRIAACASPSCRKPTWSIRRFRAKGLGIVVKTEAPPLSLVESLRRQVWAVDSTVVLSHITSAEQDIRDKSAQPRFGLVSIGGFAGIGLVLAMVGVFSVMAYAVSVRRREIGIRMALGAQRGQSLGMVLRKGLTD